MSGARISDMELLNRITRRQRALRVAATAALTAVAVQSLRNGKRLRGLLAAGGALAVGASTATLGPTELSVDEIVDVTADSDGLQCSVCDESIVPGQSRRPTADNNPAHETCL